MGKKNIRDVLASLPVGNQVIVGGRATICKSCQQSIRASVYKEIGEWLWKRANENSTTVLGDAFERVALRFDSEFLKSQIGEK